jgi:hypothetical protein
VQAPRRALLSVCSTVFADFTAELKQASKRLHEPVLVNPSVRTVVATFSISSSSIIFGKGGRPALVKLSA